MIVPPDKWAIEAARMPVAFAQVREDPIIDSTLVRELGAPRRICMIASGGDTAAVLASSVVELHLVDANLAQLQLTRLKLDLLSNAGAEERKVTLGHSASAPESRAESLRNRQEKLNLPVDCFGSPEMVADLGVDYAGRYECLFRELAKQINGGAHVEEALDSCMRLENLVCLFGETATQNPVQSFSRHFAERLRLIRSSHLAKSNPFLSQMLLGRFQAGESYDWHRLPERPIEVEVHYHHLLMDAALDSLEPGSLDLIHLSNILDWLSPNEAAATLDRAAKTLRPGGMVVIRQLNSSLAIPHLSSHFSWRESLAQKLHEEDRSFFYRALHIGEKR